MQTVWLEMNKKNNLSQCSESRNNVPDTLWVPRYCVRSKGHSQAYL